MWGEKVLKLSIVHCEGGRKFSLPFRVLSTGLIIKYTWDILVRKYDHT